MFCLLQRELLPATLLQTTAPAATDTPYAYMCLHLLYNPASTAAHY